ncbi:MAG: bifunctional anthranilate synthase component I family protein/class IV aminotransferase [Magnetococcales bacterium]|nr:bifunctional anthranilate synthase component I family protein/class IV aminotransferase [Magnetococcales bacterium]
MVSPDPAPDAPLPVTAERLRDGVCLLIDFPELGTPLYGSQPATVLTARRPEEVRPLIRAAEEAAAAGGWVGIWLAYEAAAAFGLPVRETGDDLPLAWCALFSHPPRPVLYPAPATLPPHAPTPPQPRVTRERFQRDLEAVATHIRAGESYQVNYTLEAALDPDTDPATLFLRLQGAHRFPKAMWIQGESWCVASFSPELFLERRGTTLLTGPIKGTRPRGDTADQDRRLADLLEHSPKDRAEHIMIVDMARNDLGQICRTGSVVVESLAARRSFSTVHHLESRVRGERRDGVDLEAVLAATFPAASITGAPKKATMGIIHALEQRPRGIYTGVMGLMAPGGDCWLNVAIRTVVQTPRGCRIGLGGGVVADSRPEAEWAEVGDKSRFLTTLPAELELIETFRVEASGAVAWLPRHLERLAASARALGLSLDRAKAERLVRDTAQGWAAAGWTPRAGRLALSAGGDLTLTHRPLIPWPTGIRARIASWRPDPLDPLARHKTNRRLHPDAEWQAACREGYDEVIFINREGRVTEGAISGLLARLEGRWLAPKETDGLCPSLWRAETMTRLQATTAHLTLADLYHAEEIRIGNAVRGGGPIIRLDNADGEPIQQWAKQSARSPFPLRNDHV